MGIFDRFKKKDDDFSMDDHFDSSDSSPGFDKPDSSMFADNSSSNNMNPGMGTEMSQNFGNESQETFGSSFNNMNQNSNEPSFSNMNNFDNSQNNTNNNIAVSNQQEGHKHKSDLQRDIQLILSKLDTVKAMVETMNQRLTNLEHKTNSNGQIPGHRSSTNGRYW